MKCVDDRTVEEVIEDDWLETEFRLLETRVRQQNCPHDGETINVTALGSPTREVMCAGCGYIIR